MDRKIVYPGAIPLETDILNTNKNALIGLAKLAGGILGTATLVNGLACTANSPAAMNVLVAPGEIYALDNIDATDYGSLLADTTHSIVKQGIVLDTQTFSTPAPATSGHAVNYLIQAAYQNIDSDSVVLPYYNASNPSVAYSGPGNTGVAQYTTRKGVCTVSIKTGVSALAGTQVTPTPDVGFTGLWVVTVLQGATTVTSGNISQYANAPFITERLIDKISQATADTRYAQITSVQKSSYTYAHAAGSTTAYTATYSPAPTLTDGMELTIDTTDVGTNTIAAPTFSPNGLTAAVIKKDGGMPLTNGDMPDKALLHYVSSGAYWLLLNPRVHQRLLTGLDYPTIATATNKATVTPSTDAAGGKVTLTAGDAIELGKKIGTNGIMCIDVTTGFVSPSLNISSTYYLRCMYVGNTLTFYVQKGTDADAIPTGLVGTVNGTSGGGFDSTQLDMLIAKITTSTAGTMPTVTTLANNKSLYFDGTFTATATSLSTITEPKLQGDTAPVNTAIEWTKSVTLNWARTCKTKSISGVALTTSSGQYADGWQNNVSYLSYDRYALVGYIASDWTLNMTGLYAIATLNLSAMA